ncbi:19031_t:CDS:2 [Gigaspora rosea]|nr:19031_t:CDS:2 [Gigaspora rosea]
MGIRTIPLLFFVLILEEFDRPANSTYSKKRWVEHSTLKELLEEEKALNEEKKDPTRKEISKSASAPKVPKAADEEFFLNPAENLPQELDIGVLADDDHDHMEELLIGYNKLFA